MEYIPCSILTPDVKPGMIQKQIEKKRNPPGGYIGGEKMEMVNGTARWIQLVSYSLKSLQVLLWLRLFSSEGVWVQPVRMRVSVSDSCESCKNGWCAIFNIIHSCYTLGVIYPAVITWKKADIISDIYASVKQSKLPWISVILLCICLLCTGKLLLWLVAPPVRWGWV